MLMLAVFSPAVAEGGDDGTFPDPADLVEDMGVPKELQDDLKELDDLLDKYRNAEVEFVKWEDVTITDTGGNPVACPVKIYYDNFEGAEFSTGSDGRFSGGISFGDRGPTKPICIIADCECAIVTVAHTRTFGQVNEIVERIKEAVQKKIEEDVGTALEEASEEYVEEVKKEFIKKALENTAAEGLESAGLIFAVFAEVGKVIGETIAAVLDHFFAEWMNYITEFNQAGYNPQRPEDCAPAYGRYKKHSPPGWWGRLWQEHPYLTDTWKLTVNCNGDTSRWVSPVDPDYVLPEPPPGPL